MTLSFVIAVDGPAGSGKGTLARSLAAYYDFAYLDTGLLYRALAWRMLEGALDLKDKTLATEAARALQVEDVSEHPRLRTEDVSRAASLVSSYPGVRRALLQYQRDFAKTPPQGKKGAVLDGRDIGSLVCPEAAVKLFLEANVEIRARRRYEELRLRGTNSIYADVLDDMRERDRLDRERETSPLVVPLGALVIDTSSMGPEEVLRVACAHIGQARPR
ncbi:MAG: (d)CMP kinase [Alphaproteobacteria bacterium]|nr:(d)CMP kinase [Alphaproteobacteria bacterium]